MNQITSCTSLLPNHCNIDTIMLFAAGLGTRMRHLTKTAPKSLLCILNKPILHYALELCQSYPFKQIVVNTHYLHHQIEASIEDFRKQHPNSHKIITIYENNLLETGGAIKNAYNLLGSKPIFTLNTDIILRYNKNNIFRFLEQKWNPDIADFMLLLYPKNKSPQHVTGDFDIDEKNLLVRNDIIESYEYIYTGLQILNPKTILKNPNHVFSLREYYNDNSRAFGVKATEDIEWYHASCPDDLHNIESMLQRKRISI